MFLFCLCLLYRCREQANAVVLAPNSSDMKNQQDKSAEGLPKIKEPPPCFYMNATQISKKIGAYIKCVVESYLCKLKLTALRKSDISKLDKEVMSNPISYRHVC